MNISKENIDALNAIVTIDIAKADYEKQYTDALKSYRKKVTMPGFRQGHVPAAMVEKMYGKALLADEINKLVGETISKYVEENKLEILGEPLPAESMEPIDFDKEINDVQFKFELALAPAINLELNDKISAPYYTIEIADAVLAQQKETMLARFAKNETVEAVGEKSMVKGQLAQEGAFANEACVMSYNGLKGEAAKAAILGKKAGDVVKIDINEAYASDATNKAYALGISKEEGEKAEGEYTFTIAEVTEYKDPEMNQELFDNIFGEGVVKSEEEFDAKVKESVKEAYTMEQDYRFSLDIQKQLLDTLKLELPEKFLKRWVTLINKDNEKATPEVIENEFPAFIENMKWELVKGNIIKTNSLKIEQSNLMDAAKNATRAQFAQFGMLNVPDQMLESYAKNMMQNKDQFQHVAEAAANQIVIDFIKGKVALDSKNISREEFNKLFEE